MKKLFFVPFLVLLISSCMDSTVSITLNKDLSGTLKAHYRISGESEYVSSDLVAMKYEYLPVNGDYLKRLADENAGIVLSSYKKTQSGGDVLVDMTVLFSKPADIEKISGYKGKTKILSLLHPSPGVIRIVFRNPLSRRVSAKTLRLLSALYSDRKINMSVKVAGFITNTDRGRLAEDPSVALFSFPVMTLLKERTPLVWTLTYR